MAWRSSAGVVIGLIPKVSTNTCRTAGVIKAGNDGPIPNSVGSPATSFSALSVGALDYAPSSRTLYEYGGLTAGARRAGTGDDHAPNRRGPSGQLLQPGSPE